MRGLSGGHGTDRKDSGTGLTNSGQFHEVVIGEGGGVTIRVHRANRNGVFGLSAGKAEGIGWGLRCVWERGGG